MAAYNEFAICALENRVNYVVGEGLKYTATGKDPRNAAHRKSAECVQHVIEVWESLNNLPEMEAEALWRLDVEGEFFIRRFPDKKGFDHLRFVEPELVRAPIASTTDPAMSFGIETDAEDVVSVRAYWIVDAPTQDMAPTRVVADDVIHAKLNTWSSAKRGVPTFYPVEANLKRCEDLLASMTSVAKARAKIALIRKITGLTSSTADTLLARLTAARATDPNTGETLNIEQLRYGTVLTASGNTDYQMPAANLGAGDIVEVLQAELRAVASRMVMPEWMFTALADAKFNNAFIVEAPTTKSFKRLQKRMRDAFGRIAHGPRVSLLWRQLRAAVAAGLLCANDLENVVIGCIGPTLEARDPQGEVTRHKEMVEAGFESKETAQRSLELDPEKEAPQIAREMAGRARPTADASAVAQTQEAFYAGKLPRDAAAANLMILLGFTREQAEALLPASDCVKRTDDGPQPGGMPGTPGAPAIPGDTPPDSGGDVPVGDGSQPAPQAPEHGADDGVMDAITREAMQALGVDTPEPVQEQFREAHAEGEVFQAGQRWYVVKNGHVQPAPAPTSSVGAKSGARSTGKPVAPAAPQTPPTPTDAKAANTVWAKVPEAKKNTAAAKIATAAKAAKDKELLAKAAVWADKMAAKHADAVAKKLNVSPTLARYLLANAIKSLCAKAVKTGGAATMDLDTSGSLGGGKIKLGVKVKPREAFDPNEARDAAGQWTADGGTLTSDPADYEQTVHIGGWGGAKVRPAKRPDGSWGWKRQGKGYSPTEQLTAEQKDSKGYFTEDGWFYLDRDQTPGARWKAGYAPKLASVHPLIRAALEPDAHGIDWRPTSAVPEDFYIEQTAAAPSGALVLREAGFTGVVTATNGVTYHYVDGKRVAAAAHEDHVTKGGQPSPVIKAPDANQFADIIHLVGDHYVKGEADWKAAGKAIDKVLKKYGGGQAEWDKLAAQFGFDTGGKKSVGALLNAIKSHFDAHGVDESKVVAAKGEAAAEPAPQSAPESAPQATSEAAPQVTPEETVNELKTYLNSTVLSPAEAKDAIHHALYDAIVAGHDGAALMAQALGVPSIDTSNLNALLDSHFANKATATESPETAEPDAPESPEQAAEPETPAAPNADAPELGSRDGYKPATFDPAAAPVKDYTGKSPQEIDPTWKVNPNPAKQAYGGVLVRTDPATGKTQVLLRKPTGNFDGYVWTWPKGKLTDAQKTHPDAQTAALAEVAEETGHKGEIIDHVPGVFKSDGSTTNAFFLMKSAGEDPSLMDKETAETQWVDIDKAHELIEQTTKAAGKKRDLEILEAAKAKLGSADDPKINAAADDLKAAVHALAEQGASPEQVAATFKQKLSGFHPHAVAAIASKTITSGDPADLIPKAVDFVTEHKGLPVLANIKNVKPIGKGSTGAKIGTTASGAKVVIKDGGGKPHGQEQVGNEVAADKIYQLLGANIAKSKVETKDGVKHKVAQWVEGESLNTYLNNATPEQAGAVKKEIQKQFVATALLGNWDVAGQTLDNIKVSPDGKPYLIDNGGSFDISANATKKGGTQKPFAADSVPELATLLDSAKAPQAASVFAGISKDEIVSQINDVVAKKDAILTATPTAHKAAMAKRIEYLATWAAKDGKPNAVKVDGGAHGDIWLNPKPGVHVHRNHLAKDIGSPETVDYINHIDPHEYQAIRKYTGNSYAALNSALYAKKPLDAHSQEVDDGLQGTFAKAATFPPKTLVRMMNSPGPKFLDVLQRAMASDRPIKWRNYQSAGPGGTFGKHRNMKITFENVTEGAIDVEPLTSVPGEHELLLNRGTFYKVKSVTENKGKVHVVMTQIPKTVAETGHYLEAAAPVSDGPAVTGTPGDPPAQKDPDREWTAEELAARAKQKDDEFAAQFVANMTAHHG
ncbi:Phage portal protein, lambda family [Gemmata sp. SH-PL17]|nr:Phage portal protein, lambda family [Gemmata sp. SH-PL17]